MDDIIDDWSLNILLRVVFNFKEHIYRGDVLNVAVKETHFVFVGKGAVLCPFSLMLRRDVILENCRYEG